MSDFQNMSEEQLINYIQQNQPRKYAISAPGKPPGQALNYLGAAGGDTNLAKDLQSLFQHEERPISEKLAGEYGGALTTLGRLRRMAELKNRGFGGQGIDTGPVIGAGFNIPSFLGGGRFSAYGNTLSSWWNRDKGFDASDRAALRQVILQTRNPIRKEVTGSQAGLKEIQTEIAPMVPQDSDDDIDFNRKLLEAADATIEKYQDMSQTLGDTGFRAPPTNELIKRRNLIRGFLPQKPLIRGPIK